MPRVPRRPDSPGYFFGWILNKPSAKQRESLKLILIGLSFWGPVSATNNRKSKFQVSKLARARRKIPNLTSSSVLLFFDFGSWP